MNENSNNQKFDVFSDEQEAVKHLTLLYNQSIQFIRETFKAYANGALPDQKIEAFYPCIRVYNQKHVQKIDQRLSYGFLISAGIFETSVTRPQLFRSYLLDQLRLLRVNHPEIEYHIGYSQTPMPIHYAFSEGEHLEAHLSLEQIKNIRNYFTMPDLSVTNDHIVDGKIFKDSTGTSPLSLFTAPRIDYSLHRIKHYTATNATFFQKFILFTNYQFYVEEFIRYAIESMKKSPEQAAQDNEPFFESFIKPGHEIIYNQHLSQERLAQLKEVNEPYVNSVPSSSNPQMPAYHLTMPHRLGVTIVNIGVGPSNAKTITDHVAVLRPLTWIMLGHCAGLRNSQNLGDYALAHAYVREDHVLDEELPLNIPIPALAEIQISLQNAVKQITGREDFDVKSIMRTGTIVTTDNRNWELLDNSGLVQKFSQNRAIALDMESATLAANGFRFRVPYGTLLCVSDKPLHGEIKLPAMANKFYKQQVSQHLSIGLLALNMLRKMRPEQLHSRKLRSFFEPAFQ